MSTEPTGDPHLVRVEKGRANDEEVAAVTALLMARAAQGPTDDEDAPARESRAPWRRLERARAYRAPHSWQG